MNLNLYKTYVKVVETQNLSRTADEFGLSQPAVTKQIQAFGGYIWCVTAGAFWPSLKNYGSGRDAVPLCTGNIKSTEKDRKSYGGNIRES